MTTADDFRTARFATHPDGRVAARVDPNDGLPWIATMPRGSRAYRTDEDMAADGFIPLDETRPVVVTDEDVDMALCRYYGKVHPHENGWDEHLRERMRAVLTAALSAAPTSDEGDPSVDYHAMWWKAEREREQAEAFAALWKETARRAVQTQRTYIGAARDERRARQVSEQEVGRLSQDRNQWEAQALEAEERAEKAEQERDEAIREAEDLGEALDNVKPMDTMTAREHLDAAWEAAHVPANGTIPAGVEFLWREADGTVFGPARSSYERRGSELGVERRLLDPPAPVVSYTKRLALELENAGWIREGGAEGVAKHLDALGVRAPEGGEE